MHTNLNDPSNNETSSIDPYDPPEVAPPPYTGQAFTDSVPSDRKRKYWNQWVSQGYDDSETWDLFLTIVEFTLPRLKRFRELSDGYPEDFESLEKWQETLDKMISGFEKLKEYGGWPIGKEEHIVNEQLHIERSLDLFRIYFLSLWW